MEFVALLIVVINIVNKNDFSVLHSHQSPRRGVPKISKNQSIIKQNPLAETLEKLPRLPRLPPSAETPLK